MAMAMIMAMVMTMALGQGDGNDRGLLDLFGTAMVVAMAMPFYLKPLPRPLIPFFHISDRSFFTACSLLP